MGGDSHTFLLSNLLKYRPVYKWSSGSKEIKVRFQIRLPRTFRTNNRLLSKVWEIKEMSSRRVPWEQFQAGTALSGICAGSAHVHAPVPLCGQPAAMLITMCTGASGPSTTMGRTKPVSPTDTSPWNVPMRWPAARTKLRTIGEGQPLQVHLLPGAYTAATQWDTSQTNVYPSLPHNPLPLKPRKIWRATLCRLGQRRMKT